MVATRIYALCTAHGVIRYVGKTCGTLEQRVKSHLSERNRNRPVNRWVKKHKDSFFIVQLELVPDGGNWSTAEQKWIADLRARGIPLLNLLKGGEGPNGGHLFSAAHREKIARGLRKGWYKTCAQCGEPVWVAPHNANSKKFCSRKCVGHSQQGRPATNPRPSLAAIEAARQKRLAITHCPQGHPYAGENLLASRGRRICRTCSRQATARSRAKRAEAEALTARIAPVTSLDDAVSMSYRVSQG